MISMHDRNGYHQIRVRESGQEKLALPPSGIKKTFKVMPFGPKNTPVFYTTMVRTLWKERLLLFADTKHVIPFDTIPVKVICNDKIIIDNMYFTLIMYPHFFTSFIVSSKYRSSFKLTKCDIFKPCVEFFGNDLSTYRNFPTESQFDLIKHWTFPLHVISLLSFIGLCGFYCRYFRGLRQISNYFVNWKELFIENSFLLFLGHHWFHYSMM